MSSNRLIVVVGSGPGIGTKTPYHFAKNGFNAVALLSRNAQRLPDDARAVAQAAPDAVKVKTYPVDVGDAAALKATLEKVEKDLGKPEVVLFNAARVATSTIGEESVENVLGDLRVMTLGLYVTASWALPLLSGTHPCFFLSGGFLWKHPLPGYFSLSLNKASQVNFMISLAHVANPKGIHLATIDVAGVVKDDDPVISAANIAKNFWDLYQQDKDQWEDMISLGDVEAFLKSLQ